MFTILWMTIGKFIHCIVFIMLKHDETFYFLKVKYRILCWRGTSILLEENKHGFRDKWLMSYSISYDCRIYRVCGIHCFVITKMPTHEHFLGYWQYFLKQVLHITVTQSYFYYFSGSTDFTMGSISAANAEFSFDVFKELKVHHASDNLFYSPLSIIAALAIVYLGARGNTEHQMEKVSYKNRWTPFDSIKNNPFTPLGLSLVEGRKSHFGAFGICLKPA